MAGLKETIQAIQDAVSNCDAPERELYEELHALSEGWRMRLDEIEQEEEDEDE